MRAGGTRSESVVSIRPVMPIERLMMARASMKTHTFVARIAMMPAIRCATNARTSTGWRA